VEVLILIVAFWLILIGVYGAFFLPNGSSSKPPRRVTTGSPEAPFHEAFAATQRNEERRPVVSQRSTSPSRGVVVEHRPASEEYSEVDFLRAQVEQLRNELVALTGGSARPERPRRRAGTGIYTLLPKDLRRQVHEVRSVRRPLRA
jgi:hypothetical protein